MRQVISVKNYTRRLAIGVIETAIYIGYRPPRACAVVRIETSHATLGYHHVFTSLRLLANSHVRTSGYHHVITSLHLRSGACVYAVTAAHQS